MQQLFDLAKNNIYVGSTDKLPEWSANGDEQGKAIEKVKLMLKNYLELDNVSFLFGSGSSIHLGAVAIRNFPVEVETFIKDKSGTGVNQIEGLYEEFITAIKALQAKWLSDSSSKIKKNEGDDEILTEDNGW